MITSSEKPASVIQAYPTLGGFVCKLDFSDGLCTTARPEIRTIIILDRSGSMEGQVYRFVHTVLPSMLKRLEYSSKDSITLIPFDEQASILECTIDQLYSLNIYQGGGTYMHKAIEKLTEKIAKELESYSSLKVPPLIRILSISDGAIGDQVLTQKLAASLSVTLKNSNLIVNSQAVRLFTSYSQPDTRALSSVLQFNTVNSATLVDVLSSLPDQEISETLASLFRDDGLVESRTLSSTIPVFRLNPWQELPVQSISVRVGENTFWMSELPESCTLSDENVFFSVQESLSWGPYSLLIRNKMELFLQKMRVLKVIDTSHSQIEIDLMLDYFEKLEKSWEPQDPSVNIADGNINGLKSRFSHLKQLILRKKKSIVTTFSQIANDQKVGKLNAAQQADYLRSAELTKRSKGLARRAVSATNGLDFDTVMREEVCAMHTNLQELADVDDSDHNVSFYSQETTLAGIRAVCMLVEENLIDDVDINEVIQLLNLVGIPCSHHIGEYPDPMTFRLSNIMVGSYVSLSDVLVAHIQSNGQILRTPGTNHEISNVIPVFEDERILRFLSKYAPTMLEYTASVGMRRMLADVPLTFAYTSLAGIWRMVEELNLNKSEINIRTFIQLVQNFRIYSAKFFTHITKYLKPQEQCSTISLYLANHGVIDLISPMISRLQDSDFPTVLPALMRALYTFEVWQIIRKMYKNQERSKDIIESALNQLLNVDLDKTRTVPMPLFKEEPAKPTFCRSYERNEDYLDELMKKIAFIDYISLLSPFLEATVRQGLTMEERISLIRDIPTMTDESVSNALGIPYDLRAFKFYNIAQAFLYTTMKERIDGSETMTIPDLGKRYLGERMISKYVCKRHRDKYFYDVSIKGKEEQIEIAHRLVDRIIEAPTLDEFITLLENGITEGCVHWSIVNSNTLGYFELNNRLTDLSQEVPLRADKLKIFILGRTTFYGESDNSPYGKMVWNNGNVLIVPSIVVYKRFFESEDVWNNLYEEYQRRRMHHYREKVNRHGHSNSLPSFWAFGYATLETMQGAVSVEFFQDYCSKHVGCCGL